MIRAIAVFLAPCLVLGLGLALPAKAAEPGPEAIKAYILAHPEVIFEALAKDKEALFQMVLAGRDLRQRRLWRQDIKAGLAHPLEPKLEQGRPVMGDPKAPLLVVEYSDFMCPACSRGASNMEKLLAKHPDKFRMVLKHMPSGDLSRQLALYYEAIARQDPEKARSFSRQIYKRQKELADKGLKVALEVVKDLKLDQARLSRDLADKKLAQRLKDDTAEGKSFKLGGTPGFVVAGVPIRGVAPLSAFEDVWYISQGKQQPSLPK